MKVISKSLLSIISVGLFSVHTISGQVVRKSANTGIDRTVPSGNLLRSSTSTSSLMPSAGIQTQKPHIPDTSEWKTMNTQEKKEAVNNMSAKDRSFFLQKMKENIVIDDLKIPLEKQEEFKILYADYQNNQKQIREKFIVDKNIANLSEAEAIKRLNQSFEVGQQLLDNRRSYADKFLKILTPQQVLKLFQTEGKMREKLLDKKNDK